MKLETEVLFQVSTNPLTPNQRVYLYQGPELVEIRWPSTTFRWNFHIQYDSRADFDAGHFKIRGLQVFRAPEKTRENEVPIGAKGDFLAGVRVDDNGGGENQSMVLNFDSAVWPEKGEVYYYTIDATYRGAKAETAVDWDPSMVIEPGGGFRRCWWRLRRWLKGL